MSQKAKSLADFFNVFKMDALTNEQFDFYQNMAIARTGDAFEFYINLYERIMLTESNVRLLVVGHGGCGKSTEMNMLANKLNENNVVAHVIDAAAEMDRNSFTYIDVIILIVLELIKLAKDIDLSPDKNLINAFDAALSTKTKVKTVGVDSNVGIEGDASVKAGLLGLIKIVTNLSSALKMSAGIKEEIRKEITPKTSDIIEAANALHRDIFEKLKESKKQSKKPVIIIDGLEKCNEECVKSFFIEIGPSISSLDINLIICCPISLQRSADFSIIQGYFKDTTTMPMIKVHHQKRLDNGEPDPYKEGIEVLKLLVYKRVDKKFIDEDVLKEIIMKTGGSLRDLCDALSNIALISHMYKKEKIESEIARDYLKKRSTELFLRIESQYFSRVKKIYEGDNKICNDKELSRLLYAGVVFEYNGDRWCDLHPLIRDYIKSKGVEILNG